MGDTFNYRNYLKNNPLLTENKSTIKKSDLLQIIKEEIEEAKKKKKDEEENPTEEIPTETPTDQSSTEEAPTSEPSMEMGSEPSAEAKDVKSIQGALKTAYDEALTLQDEKLVTQIANTITYFTKNHILRPEGTNQ
jgi:hypothetical protein